MSADPDILIGLSWMGTSCLKPYEVERELAAMREKPILISDKKDPFKATKGTISKLRRTVDADVSGGGGAACPWRPPSRFSTTSGPVAAMTRTRSCSPSLSKLPTDEIILAFQEATNALLEALTDEADYRLAQRSMNHLDDLENALWEAHAYATRTAANIEAQELQKAHELERQTLEETLTRQELRLKEGCRDQARCRRQEHEERLVKLDRLPQSDHPAKTATVMETTVEPRTAAAAAFADAIAISRLEKPRQYGPRDGETTAEARQTGAGQEDAARPMPSRLHSTVLPKGLATVQSAPAVAESGAEPIVRTAICLRSKELMDLRNELAKHLAVAHVDGGQHLQEATRVMRLIEELETKAKLGEKAKLARPGGCDTIEKSLLQQKHARAERVQRDKHQRLLRTLQRSRAESLRLLRMHHRGAFHRAAHRRREADRRQQQNLRERLVTMKGIITRAWKDHNRRYLSSGLYAGDGMDQSRGRRKTGSVVASPAHSRGGEVIEISEVHIKDCLKAFGSSEEPACDPTQATSTGISTAATIEKGNVWRGITPLRQQQGEGSSKSVAQGRNGALDGHTAAGNDDSLKVVSAQQRSDHRKPVAAGIRVALSQGITEAVRSDSAAATVSPGGLTEEIANVEVLRSSSSAACDTSKATSAEKSKSHRVPLLQSKRRTKRRATSPVTDATRANTPAGHVADAARITNVSAAASVSGALCGSLAGVLTTEEAKALAALGKGTPNDPRLLLLRSSLSPSEARVELWRDDHIESVTAHDVVNAKAGTTAASPTIPCCRRSTRYIGRLAAESYGCDVASEEGAVTGATRASALLDHVVDKVVSKMRIEEDVARHSLGMAPLSSAW